jgi:PIN domain nuclease of toxin-antitoxin system
MKDTMDIIGDIVSPVIDEKDIKALPRLKLLLDTHVWLWALHNPSLLSHRVRDMLRNPANELWLSPVSTWEALLLHAKVRVRLPANLSEWLTAATAPLREAPLTHEIVLIAEQFPLPQCDPADRFLAATAQVMDLECATKIIWPRWHNGIRILRCTIPWLYRRTDPIPHGREIPQKETEAAVTTIIIVYSYLLPFLSPSRNLTSAFQIKTP